MIWIIQNIQGHKIRSISGNIISTLMLQTSQSQELKFPYTHLEINMFFTAEW
jgi:hypothetical protein